MAGRARGVRREVPATGTEADPLADEIGPRGRAVALRDRAVAPRVLGVATTDDRRVAAASGRHGADSASGLMGRRARDRGGTSTPRIGRTGIATSGRGSTEPARTAPEAVGPRAGDPRADARPMVAQRVDARPVDARPVDARPVARHSTAVDPVVANSVAVPTGRRVTVVRSIDHGPIAPPSSGAPGRARRGTPRRRIARAEPDRARSQVIHPRSRRRGRRTASVTRTGIAGPARAHRDTRPGPTAAAQSIAPRRRIGNDRRGPTTAGLARDSHRSIEPSARRDLVRRGRVPDTSPALDLVPDHASGLIGPRPGPRSSAPRPRSSSPRTRSSSPGAAPSRRPLPPGGRPFACSSCRIVARRWSGSCSTRPRCGSRSWRSRAGR